jgi:TonB family protein
MTRVAALMICCLAVGCSTAPTLAPPKLAPPKPAPELAPTNLHAVSNECRELGKLADVNFRVVPEYPPEALKSDQQGWVVFTFDVESGRVVRPEVVSSSPRGLFDNSILVWSRTLVYPSGKSARGCRIEYHFKLD